jgi:hypothetical protein
MSNTNQKPFAGATLSMKYNPNGSRNTQVRSLSIMADNQITALGIAQTWVNRNFPTMEGWQSSVSVQPFDNPLTVERPTQYD